jgi:multicomponent Na+:H+ antiporter subunit E
VTPIDPKLPTRTVPQNALHIVRRSPKALVFLARFLVELVHANVLVAGQVLRPRHGMTPVILQLPIRSRTDLEVTLLVCLITLTPGTLVLAVAPDRRSFYLHALQVESRQEFSASIAALESRMLRVLR